MQFRALMALVLGAVVGCSGSGAETEARNGAPGAGASVHEYAHLEDEVERLLDFLGGGAPLPTGLLADSVRLQVVPEGGGETAVVAAGDLDARSAWRVGGRSLVPPETYDHRTLLPGLHSNCMPGPLETLFPELARRPHVGVRLASRDEAPCLQTWNATFVFDEGAESPRLTAVVYDQWEW